MARKKWWLAALVCGATLLVYWPSLHGQFLWNDSDYVTAPALRSAHGLWRIWFEIGAVQQYYPILHTAFWFEHRLWGDAVTGYHLVNLLLHATSAILLAGFLTGCQARQRRAAGEPDPAPAGAMAWPWLAAFLFALHPVCVESVAWITEQKNTLSTVFYLLSALVYLRFDENRRRRTYGLATLLFTLAILSKSVAATLPAALLVVIWWQRGRVEWKRDVVPLLPWFVLGAAEGLFTAWVEVQFIGAQGEVFRLSFLQRFLVAGRAVWFYLGKLFWPHPLIFIYPRWKIDASVLGQYLYPLSLLALLGLLWRGRNRSRAPLAALLFFIGSLFPVLGFFNVYAFNFSYVADHFQYLPALGVIALVAGGWNRWPGARRSQYALAGLVLFGLGALTWRQCRNYRDEETFYRTILENNPASWMAHNNLGVWLKGQGKTREAWAEYGEALRFRPDFGEAEDNLGIILVEEHHVPEAIDRFRAVIAAEPRFADAHRNLANALFSTGRTDEALAHYDEALRLRGHDAHTWNDVGSALFKLNRLEEAEDRFHTALRLDPGFSEAHGNLGNVLVRMGQIADGSDEYTRALQLDPENISARCGLGVVLAQTGHLPEALEQFQAALHSKPNSEEAHNNLGNVLLALGRPEEARAQFEEILRINPSSAAAINNLGNVLARTGHSQEALIRYEEALRIDPRYIEAQINLGVTLCRLGRLEEGIGHFEAALRIDPDSAQAKKDLERAEALVHARSP